MKKDNDQNTPGGPPLFAATFLLALLLVAVKWSYGPLSHFWKVPWKKPQALFTWKYFKWLAGASYSDVMFAVGTGVLILVLFVGLKRFLKARQTISYGFVVFGVVCAVYSVVSRQVYAYFGSPLTYHLMAMAADPTALRSSLAPYLTLPVIAALVGMPSLFVVGVWVSAKARRKMGAVMLRSAQVAGIMVVVSWLFLGYGRRHGNFFRFQDRYIAESPHWIFIQSGFFGLLELRPALSTNVDRDQICEFAEIPAGASGGFASALNGTENPDPRPRNLILVVLESVGSEYLGIYGNPFDAMPTVTNEAQSIEVFDAYYTPVGWTAYALTSIVDGLRPSLKTYNTRSFTLDNRKTPTLATVLSEAGYKTAFMSAGDPDWATKGFFDGKGFGLVMGPKEMRAGKISSWGTRDGVVFDNLIRWIQEKRDQPFFVMAWTEQTHHPYKLGPDQEMIRVDSTKNDLNRYLTLIRAADREIGRLIDVLRREDLADNTVLVITGDHGEAFGRIRPVSGHGFTVYDEEVRVPLILWSPVLFEGGRRSSVVGSHVDLNPTLLDILGYPAPAGWDGRSLFDPDRSPRTYLFAAAWGGYLLGVREDEWKYIYNARTGVEELYDLSDDPNELTDVARQHPDRSARLREYLGAWLQAQQLRMEGRSPDCPSDR